MQEKSNFKEKVLKLFLYRLLNGVQFRLDFRFSTNPKSKELDCKTNLDFLPKGDNVLEYDSET